MSKEDYAEQSLEAHKKYGGKVSVKSKMPLDTREDLSTAYTPGVAKPCEEIRDDVSKVYDYTWKSNSVAVVSDGSAVLGLGNIGPEAALPVMEGKAVLFKKFANIDAVPVVLNTQNEDEIVAAVEAIAPTYGGINLEDIAAPRCFKIEKALKKSLDIPVMHDDQHGTAVVTLAGLINAMRVTDREMSKQKVVVNGAGSAGVAIVKLLQHVGVKEILVCDSTGILYEGRDNMNATKQDLAKTTNPDKRDGSLEDAIENTDIFIGVSVPGVLDEQMIHSMNDHPIIFAMANPTPEIMPDDAKEAGAQIVATGRSDFPNQVNNVLAFPGLFRGALNARNSQITYPMFSAAARAIADCVDEPSAKKIIPSAFDKRVAQVVAESVEEVCREEG